MKSASARRERNSGSRKRTAFRTCAARSSAAAETVRPGPGTESRSRVSTSFSTTPGRSSKEATIAGFAAFYWVSLGPTRRAQSASPSQMALRYLARRLSSGRYFIQSDARPPVQKFTGPKIFGILFGTFPLEPDIEGWSCPRHRVDSVSPGSGGKHLGAED